MMSPIDERKFTNYEVVARNWDALRWNDYTQDLIWVLFMDHPAPAHIVERLQIDPGDYNSKPGATPC